MTSRISRLVKRTGLVRKPRIVPMSVEDRRNNDELHRRREAARLARETREVRSS